MQQCPSCQTALPSPVKFCPSCGGPVPSAPEQPELAARGQQKLGELQAQIANLAFVKQVEARVDQFQLPVSLPGQAVDGGAPHRDYIWSGVLLAGTVLGLFLMKWWVIPFYLAVAAAALFFGMRTGVSLLMRSLLFIAAGGVGMFALFKNDNPGALGAVILTVVLGRGLWGVFKEFLPAAGSPGLAGKRLYVALGGLALALISLAFQWEPITPYASTSWVRSGTLYTDGSGRVVRDATYTIPQVTMQFLGGGNGSEAFIFLAAVGVLILLFRNKPWPFWMRAGLTFATTMLFGYGIKGVGVYLGMGVILFWIGLAAVTAALFTHRMPAQIASYFR